MASDDPFAGFDWQRRGSDASRGSRGSLRGVGGAYLPTTNGHAYEQVDYEPTHSRSQSINNILSSTKYSPRRQQFERQKAASFESSLEAERYVRKPFMPVGITVEDLDGASAVSKSPGRRSVGVAESPARFSPRLV